MGIKYRRLFSKGVYYKFKCTHCSEIFNDPNVDIKKAEDTPELIECPKCRQKGIELIQKRKKIYS